MFLSAPWDETAQLRDRLWHGGQKSLYNELLFSQKNSSSGKLKEPENCLRSSPAQDSGNLQGEAATWQS